ncbi:MAG: LytTR family DNA-binding domain-containing protein [Pannonibacter sp.]
MTDGSVSGTSGETRRRLGPWGLIALVSIPVCLVNATSVLIELQRLDLGVHPAEPFFWEFSSAAILVLMAPLVGKAVARWPLQGPGLWTSLALHLALTLPFSLAHIAGIFALRQGLYGLLGHSYNFFGSGVWLTALYEWRKDVISYGIFVAVFSAAIWLAHRREAASAAAAPQRIEVRDGGRTLFIAPADIFFLEAAGNYVEIHTAKAKHLIRGTLAAWEQKLTGHGFARIHRSRLVNTVHVAGLAPTGSGDFEVTLLNGQTLQGSRRFRAGLG